MEESYLMPADEPPAPRAMCYPIKGGIWPQHDFDYRGICKRCGKTITKPTHEKTNEHR